MKKYLIAVAALGLLAACSGKSNKNVPVEVEEESVTVAEAVPDAASIPVLPQVKDKLSKPVNMRDSLKVDKSKGSVIMKKYKGTVPAADGPGIVYDLTLYYQQDSPDGVYQMDATYLDTPTSGQNQTFTSTGKRMVKQGTPAAAAAVIYELIPNDGSGTVYLLVEAEGNSLTFLNQELQKAASDLNYTLNLVQ